MELFKKEMEDKGLDYDFEKQIGRIERAYRDLIHDDEEDDNEARYSVYVYHHPQTGLIYNVVSNKSKGNLLIPEKKECDYFLMITGEAHEKEKQEALKKMKSIPMILTAFEIDPEKLKSRDHLILND